jgi:phage-related protein
VTASSDQRLKIEIETLENSLEKILKLRGVSYRSLQNQKRGVGVIAQEIEEILPEVVQENPDGYLSVAYGNITSLLIEAIKELKAQIDTINQKLS